MLVVVVVVVVVFVVVEVNVVLDLFEDFLSLKLDFHCSKISRESQPNSRTSTSYGDA